MDGGKGREERREREDGEKRWRKGMEVRVGGGDG